MATSKLTVLLFYLAFVSRTTCVAKIFRTKSTLLQPRQEGNRWNFKEISKNFQPIFQSNFKPLLQAPNHVSTSKLRFSIRRSFFRQVNICTERFIRCSQHLSPEFCASPTTHLTFYFWARNVAKDIMESDSDGHIGVKCSPDFVKYVLLGENSDHRKHDKIRKLVKEMLKKF